MKLIIMRHGEASWAAASDADRALTDDGHREVMATARRLSQQIRIDQVLASPYRRAQQTGRIVAEGQGCSLQTLESLTPDGRPQEVVEQLPDSGVVLLASHMPLVGRLAGLLCDGVTAGGPGFGTAHALVLEMDFPASGMASAIGWVTPH